MKAYKERQQRKEFLCNCGAERANGNAKCKQCLVKIGPYRIKSRAHSWVHDAILYGMLPAIDGSIACVDCGDSATQYEHRDYSKPLEVDPVCQPCNGKRGAGIVPELYNGRFALVVAAKRGRKPPRKCA